MRIILSIINAFLLAILLYILTYGVYIDVLGYLICILSICLFGIIKEQWRRSGFLVISLVFNPVRPLPELSILDAINPAFNVVLCSVFILYNLYYAYKVYKFD